MKSALFFCARHSSIPWISGFSIFSISLMLLMQSTGTVTLFKVCFFFLTVTFTLPVPIGIFLSLPVSLSFSLSFPVFLGLSLSLSAPAYHFYSNQKCLSSILNLFCKNRWSFGVVLWETLTLGEVFGGYSPLPLLNTNYQRIEHHVEAGWNPNGAYVDTFSKNHL